MIRSGTIDYAVIAGVDFNCSAESHYIKSRNYDFQHQNIWLGEGSSAFVVSSSSLAKEEKQTVLESLGLDVFILIPFTKDLAQTPAAEFMKSLVETHHLADLWTGADFTLGRGREGDVPFLNTLGQRLNYSLTVVEFAKRDETKI